MENMYSYLLVLEVVTYAIYEYKPNHILLIAYNRSNSFHLYFTEL